MKYRIVNGQKVWENDDGSALNDPFAGAAPGASGLGDPFAGPEEASSGRVDATGALPPKAFVAPPEDKLPFSIAPITVQASRIDPLVSGTTLQRVAPGTKSYGEAPDDFSFVDRRRFNPMTLVDAEEHGLFESRVPRGVEMSPSDAYRAGLIDVYSRPPADNGRMTVETPQQIGLVDAMRGARDRSMEMVSPDALAMRQGFRDVSAAGRTAATVRATGRVGGAKEVVASILGERSADAASGRRMREARVTPLVRDGMAYDPYTGDVATLPKSGPARPQTWGEYTPKELGDMVNDAVKSMMPEGDSTAFQKALMMAKTDQEKQAVYQQFSARPTPAQQLILDTAVAELKKRQGTVSNGKGAGAAAGGKYSKWQ